LKISILKISVSKISIIKTSFKILKLAESKNNRKFLDKVEDYTKATVELATICYWHFNKSLSSLASGLRISIVFAVFCPNYIPLILIGQLLIIFISLLHHVVLIFHNIKFIISL
jgi:hypothetical protein